MGQYNQHPIRAAASVANPFDFVKASRGMLNTMFDKYLAESLQTWAERYNIKLRLTQTIFRNKDILTKAPEHFDIEFGNKEIIRTQLIFSKKRQCKSSQWLILMIF